MPAQHDGVRFEVVDASRDDGSSLKGLRAAGVAEPLATVLYLHGNGGCAANRAPLIAPLCHHGFDVIVADYRGYGINPGRPTMRGLTDDTRSWLTYARANTASPLLVFGHSLGGTLAALALSRDQRGTSGLLTLGAVATLDLMLPGVLAPLVLERFDLRPLARQIEIPWIVAHEMEDELVPYPHALHICSADGPSSGVRHVQLAGGGHALEWQKVLPLLACLARVV